MPSRLPLTGPLDIKKAEESHNRRQKKAGILKATINRTNRVPKLSDLIESIIEQFGGAENLAKEFWKVYQAAPKGHQTSAKILERIMELMKIHADRYSEVDPIEEMSDNELEIFLFSESAGLFHDLIDSDETQDVDHGERDGEKDFGDSVRDDDGPRPAEVEPVATVDSEEGTTEQEDDDDPPFLIEAND